MNPILIVDDEAAIAMLVRRILTEAGYRCQAVTDSRAAANLLEKNRYDLVLLDVMMPHLDGYDLLAYLRPTGTPCIFITAKDAVAERVRGLNSGADDYIVKPFDAKEVTARIKAVLRRSSAKEEENKGVYDFDNLHLDMNRYELKVKGKVVEAPPKELELLACLAGHPNRVYTRDQLLDEVWGFEYYGDSRTIDVHVKRLREKLEGASEQWSLKTVWGAISSRSGNEPPQHDQPRIFRDHRRRARAGAQRYVRDPDSAVGGVLHRGAQKLADRCAQRRDSAE